MLVPGDVCAVPRGAVPADLLLLSGTCIVNEAMLTGESIPQVKESVPHGGNAGDTLAAISNPKLHLLFRGTEVVQVGTRKLQAQIYVITLCGGRRPYRALCGSGSHRQHH